MGKTEQITVLKKEDSLSEMGIDESRVNEFHENYMGLTIDGREDEEGYNIVYAAHQEVKSYLTDFRKFKKAAIKKINDFKKEVADIGDAHEAKALEVESYLAQQRKPIDDAIKEEKERKKREEEERINSRKQAVFSAGMTFNGSQYVLDHFIVTEEEILEKPDDQFDVLLNVVSDYNVKKIEDQAARDAELEELRKLKAEKERQEQEKNKPVEEKQQPAPTDPDGDTNAFNQDISGLDVNVTKKVRGAMTYSDQELITKSKNLINSLSLDPINQKQFLLELVYRFDKLVNK